MPTSYLPYEPEQMRLLSPMLAEWLPERHSACFPRDRWIRWI